MEKVAIVAVTFKRQELLSGLLDSILESTEAPWRVVVVDNEASDETAAIVADFARRADRLWGTGGVDARGGESRAVYCPQDANLGGSGGFSAGVARAFDLGAEWFWLMDDDVAVLPDGLSRLAPWAARFDVVQGSRYDFDGGPFYWQYRLSTALGIYNPFAPPAFDSADCTPMNVACFEGGLFRRRVVERIGLPDPRFFLYWDDAVYGYLASKVCRPVAVPDFVLRRTREVENVAVGHVRQLNSASDATRYHIMRNRGYMARYFEVHGDWHRFAFGVGTLLTFAKELVRLVAVDRAHLRSGAERLFSGWRDARAVLHDPKWRPMPPLGQA